jgi:hypothetical protein
MWPILKGITRFFDAILSPFAGMHPWVGLTVVSVVTGVVMLLIFGRTSNQGKIAATKDKLKAYVMEMWIFRNDTRVMFAAIGNVFRNNAHYLRHSLRPLLFIFVPVLLIMVQLGIRYADAPLMPGQTAVVTVKLRDDALPSQTHVAIVPPENVSVISPALRIDAGHEIDWKIRADASGQHSLVFDTPGGRIEKALDVGPEQRLGKVGAVRARANTWDAFLYPSEPPIPRDSVVESIHVTYPHRELAIFGINVNWLVAFFIISLVAGFALKGAFGIEV